MIATASDTLSGVVPARLQKASLDDDALVLELFCPAPPHPASRKAWLEVRAGVASIQGARPASSATPGRPSSALQGLVRKEAVPSNVVAVDAANPAAVRVVLARPDDKRRVVVVERLAADPRALILAVTDEGERILAVLLGAPRAKDGRDLRRGQLYVAPAAGPLVNDTTAAAGPARVADPLAELRVRLRAEIKRVRRLASALEGDLKKHGDPRVHEQDGELLKTVLGSVVRGMDHVDVTDFEGAARTIRLDPKKDARGNLTALFSRAKKARTAIDRTQPRLDEARAQLAAVLAAEADLGTEPERAAAVLASKSAAASTKRTIAKAGKRQPWRSFKVTKDVVVRVGRGAKDNDALVRSARGHDLWLHVREKAGGHVVIPSKGDDIPPEVLLDAAHLAAHFSSARGEPRVDVQHTRVKNLKKAGAPGLFLVAHETVLHLRVDSARIAALLEAEVAS